MKAKTSPLPAASPARTYGVALASVFVATVLRWLLQPALGPNLQFITYFPAVFVTAVLGGLQPALIATALSLFLAEYLFFLPAEGFNFHDTSALTGLLLFGVTSVGIGWLGQARLRGLARARQAAQEAQRQEQLAGEAEATYRALAELSPDAILVKQNRAYVFANPAAARLCGAANEHELIGRTPYEFLDAEVQDVVRQRVQRVLEDHVAASALQCRWRRLDGSAVEVELAAGPLTWRGEPAVQLVLRDITERKRTEERLQQTQRMDAVGRLAGGVAHEVNNQMTVVLGMTEFLLKRPDLPPWARADLDDIRRAAQSSSTVTRQLLAFGRRQMLSPEPLDLNAVVNEMASMLQRTLGPSIRLELGLEPNLGTVVADQAQLTQALLNLALNARDAMAGTGVLSVQTSTVQGPPVHASDDGIEATSGTYVALRVSDTGVGMDRATMSRVFEPFFTTKPVGQGSGLGLAMVYGMVRQSHGYVTVESEPGAGSTFTIYLRQMSAPTAATHAITTRSPVGAPPPPEAGPPRLAVVAEDETAVRGIIVRVLQEEGFEVLETADGAAALALIGQLQPDGLLQLVVTDLAMPLMGGRELAARLRGMGWQVPVLFTSGYTDQDGEGLGPLSAGAGVLRKPFSPDVLLERVRQLTGPRRRPGSPPEAR